MKIFNTKVHGVLDYLMGIVLIIAPWLLNFVDGGPAQVVPMVVGIMMLVMSLFTNYELGLIRVISMRFHLTMDVLAGLFLALSPWLFNFNEYIYLPHLILGVLEIMAGLFTNRQPFPARFTSGTTSRA